MALAGEALNRPTYSFLQTISEGSNSICRLVEHEIFGQQMVQKTISLLGVPDGLARSEPRLLVGLDHDHLVRVREAQWDPDYPVDQMMVTFVTEYYEGKSVQTAQADGHVFSVGVALAVAGDVLEALHHLHVSHRLIHRDVKPGNVMLNGDRDYARLGDLGSAALLAPGESTVQAASGTLLYRAPEYSAGFLDARSDLFGVGMLVFEMLNGPFPYDVLDGDELERRADAGKITLLPRYLRNKPWVPTSVARFTSKLMAPEPARRYLSASDALTALRRLDFVDWAETSNTEWQGTYPQRVPASRRRHYRVQVVPVDRGRQSGRWKLSASWRRAGGAWRNYANLERFVDAGDSDALASFFRAVERLAQSAPTS
jgi:serine/threonine protein kinase